VAVEEVDNAIKQYRALLERQHDLGVALDQSRRAVDLATERYELGLTDFLNVLDAQRQEFEHEDQYAPADSGAATGNPGDVPTVICHDTLELIAKRGLWRAT
jgi:outer membrane protein TolC